MIGYNKQSGIGMKEWQAKYEQEAEKLIIQPGFKCYYEPEKGFFYWRVFQDIFEIDHTCTNDGLYMYNKANEMAKEKDCSILRTATHRDPAAYMRKFKCTPNITLSGLRPNGVFYWVFEKGVV